MVHKVAFTVCIVTLHCYQKDLKVIWFDAVPKGKIE